MIDLPPEHTAGEINTPITLTCNTTAKPEPVYTWYKLVANDNQVLPNEKHAILAFEKLGPEDRGVYSCSAMNDLGTTSSSQAILSIDGIFVSCYYGCVIINTDGSQLVITRSCILRSFYLRHQH